MSAVGRPVWWLDVDGVINASPAPSRKMLDQFEHRVVAVSSGGVAAELPLWWRPAVVNFINNVSRDGRAEVRWLTTRGQQARAVLAPVVGLDDFVVAGEQPDGPGAYPGDAQWWKVVTIREQHDGSDRLVFTDDDLSARSRQQVRSIAESALLVTPMSSPGLTDQHLTTIEAYLAV